MPASAEWAAAAAAAEVAAGEAAAELFHDALELPALPQPSGGEGLRFEDAALLHLRYMCRTGDQTVAVLQARRPRLASAASSWFGAWEIKGLAALCKVGMATVPGPPNKPATAAFLLLQTLELRVHALQEQMAQLAAAAEERERCRRWLPQLPDTVSTRQALLAAALLASSSATVALLWGQRHPSRPTQG